MIEDIKKEILSCNTEILYVANNEKQAYLKYSDVVIILDKYKDQECNYKKAWNELWNYADKEGAYIDLEQKYNIGGNEDV